MVVHSLISHAKPEVVWVAQMRRQVWTLFTCTLLHLQTWGGDPGPILASVSPSVKPEQCASMSKAAARRDGDKECKLPAPHKTNIQSISFVPVGREVVSAL